MFCPNCGNELPDDAVFCSECGKNINSNSDSSEPKHNSTVIDSNGKPINATGGIRIMILGIISAYLCALGVPGIVLSAITLSQSNKFINEYGLIWGTAKAGKICAKVALPISIVMTVFWVLYVIFLYYAMVMVMLSGIK